MQDKATGMDEAALQHAIIVMLAKERGVRFEQITPVSALAEDLGMHGDDAVDFFLAFEEQFGVELSAFWPHLTAYFGTEGFPIRGLLAFLAIAGFAGAVAGVAPGPSWLSGTATFAALLFIAERIRRRRQLRRGVPVPVVVQDLFDAATARRWVKPFELRFA